MDVMLSDVMDEKKSRQYTQMHSILISLCHSVSANISPYECLDNVMFNALA